MQRFLCVSCGHTVSVLPGTRLTYRPLEVGRLQGFFDAQAGVSFGLDPPAGLVEAGCLQRAWNRLLTRVDSLKESFGQILPAKLSPSIADGYVIRQKKCLSNNEERYLKPWSIQSIMLSY